MTREQAIKTAEMSADYVRATISANMTFCDLVTSLEALGLLKLDEPTPAATLPSADGLAKADLRIVSNVEVLNHLGRVMTELRSGPAKVDCAGRLTEYGAGCILDYLQSSCGYEIVARAEPQAPAVTTKPSARVVPVIHVPVCPNANRGLADAVVREDDLIKTLRDAGYEVTKRWPKEIP